MRRRVKLSSIATMAALWSFTLLGCGTSFSDQNDDIVAMAAPTAQAPTNHKGARKTAAAAAEGPSKAARVSWGREIRSPEWVAKMSALNAPRPPDPPESVDNAPYDEPEGDGDPEYREETRSSRFPARQERRAEALRRALDEIGSKTNPSDPFANVSRQHHAASAAPLSYEVGLIRQLDAPNLSTDFYGNHFSAVEGRFVILLDDVYYSLPVDPYGQTLSANALPHYCQQAGELPTLVRLFDKRHLVVGCHNHLAQTYSLEFVSIDESPPRVTSIITSPPQASPHEYIISASAMSQTGQLLLGTRLGQLLRVDPPYNAFYTYPNLNFFAPDNGRGALAIAISPDERYVAFGRNNGAAIHSWPDMSLVQSIEVTGGAAVKALSWHPKKHSYLALGGGLSDRSIHVVDVSSWTVLLNKPTGAQVRDIQWTEDGRELVVGTGRGYAGLQVWSFSQTPVPSLQQESIIGAKRYAAGQLGTYYSKEAQRQIIVMSDYENQMMRTLSYEKPKPKAKSAWQSGLTLGMPGSTIR